MKKATTAQIAKIHVLLSQLNLMDAKKELVLKFSDGRVESSKELRMEEAKSLIQALSKHDPCDLMRRKVFALAYEANIIWGATPEDKKMNIIKLNRFLIDRGTVKKELNKLTYQELVYTVSQFQQIVKHKEDGKAAKLTTSLLSELKISTSFKRHSKTV